MNRTKRTFVHWIAAFAILMSAIAPTISQAVSVTKDGHGFVMEVCTVDGGKIQVNVKTDGQTDTSDPMKSCPYCISHTAVTAAFNTNLTFQAPQTLALLPQLFYQSPKPLAVWVTPPSAAPPTQA